MKWSVCFTAPTLPTTSDYGRIVGGIEDYAVSLMDMFLFVYDEEQAGYFTLDDDVKQDLEDMHQQLTDAQAQMLGENYSRMVLKLNLPEEGDETFNFLQTVHKITGQYYDSDDFYLVGNSTSDYDLSTSFAHDNVMISVLSVVFVILVLLFTFQSVGLPVLLILVIQGSIWINFSFPGLTQQPHLLPELPDRHVHPDGREHRLRHRHLHLVHAS